MENSSKVLIIAGAILVVILLIGVGVMLMRNTSEPLEQVQDTSSSQGIEMLNSQLMPYVGNNKSASTIKELATKVMAIEGAENRNIELKTSGFTSTISDFSEIQAKLNNQKSYTVAFSYSTNGYINSITVTEKVPGAEEEIINGSNPIEIFNSQFTLYAGNNKSANEAITLLNLIKAEEDKAEKFLINIKLKTVSSGTWHHSYKVWFTGMEEYLKKNTEKTYKITFGYNKTNGFLSSVVIKENS